MPMLMTLRIGLPVCPFHSPLRTLVGEAAMRSSTSWTSGTTSSPSTTIDASRGMRSATWSTARSSVTLMLLAAEHRLDACAQAALLGQRSEQARSVSSVTRFFE